MKALTLCRFQIFWGVCNYAHSLSPLQQSQANLAAVAGGSSGGRHWYDTAAEHGPGKLHVLDLYNTTLAKMDGKMVNSHCTEVSQAWGKAIA